jgi:hypothetical protein
MISVFFSSNAMHFTMLSFLVHKIFTFYMKGVHIRHQKVKSCVI